MAQGCDKAARKFTRGVGIMNKNHTPPQFFYSYLATVMTKKPTHGGKRKGAGRKKGSFVNVAKKEPTKVIRIPVSKLEAVKELIKKSAVVVTILAIAL